jgi:hypothetical protein
MTSAIGSLESSIPLTFIPAQSRLDARVEDIFAQTQAVSQERPLFNLRALLDDPLEIAVGGFWGLWWVADAAISCTNLYELYVAVTDTASSSVAKIALAVKRAFLSLVSFAWDSTFLASWAHETKIISLGQYAPAFKAFGNAASLVINGIEGACSLHDLVTAHEKAVDEALASAEREKNKQRFCWSLIKLAGHVTMVAWAALGITAFALGTVFNPIVTGGILLLGCSLSLVALCYKQGIDQLQDPFEISSRV